jgi:hypothetical protein
MEEAVMNPDMMKYIAEARSQDLRREAAAARLARLARRARRGGLTVRHRI